jgi:gliding motility-associated-like protein
MVASGGGGTFTWYSDSGLTNQLSTGSSLTPLETQGTVSYFVTETENGCQGPAAEVVITINPCDLVVPTAITPGKEPNAVWEIINLDDVYPNNIVTIYNRWGNVIYEHESDPSNPYNLNPWDGTNQSNGEPLPVGSYYFVIQFNNGTEDGLNGTVTIIK